MKHLVQFSTGVASAEVAWRLVAEHGPADVVLLTADTRVEDEDNWRFGREVAGRRLGICASTAVEYNAAYKQARAAGGAR